MYILASEYEGKKKKVKIMKAGILKDIKIGENRVIATPVEVASLIACIVRCLDLDLIIL